MSRLFYKKTPSKEEVSLGKILPIFIAMQVLSSLLFTLLSEPQSAATDKKKDGTNVQLFKLIFKTLKEDKAAPLVILLAMKGGRMRAFILGKFTLAWVSCSIGKYFMVFDFLD